MSDESRKNEYIKTINSLLSGMTATQRIDALKTIESQVGTAFSASARDNHFGFTSTADARKIVNSIRSYMSDPAQSYAQAQSASTQSASDTAILAEKTGEKEKALSDIKTFDEKFGQFAYNPNDEYSKISNRAQLSAEQLYGQDLAKQNASLGITSGGAINRSLASMRQAQAQMSIGAKQSDYLRQEAGFLGKKQDAYSKMMNVYGLQDDAVRQASDQYYNNLSLQAQNAQMLYQRQLDAITNKMTSNANTWAGIGSVAGGLGGLLSGIGALAKK